MTFFFFFFFFFFFVFYVSFCNDIFSHKNGRDFWLAWLFYLCIHLFFSIRKLDDVYVSNPIFRENKIPILYTNFAQSLRRVNLFMT